MLAAVDDATVGKIEERYEKASVKRQRQNVRAFAFARCEAKVSHQQLELQEKLGVVPKGALPSR